MAMQDPYMQWRAAQQATLGNYQLGMDPTLNPAATAADYTTLTAPAFIQGESAPMGADTGMMVGAGIQAAGQTAGALARAAGQKATNDAWVLGNELNRSSTEKMARAQLLQESKQFDERRQLGAYEAMLQALTNANSSNTSKRALQRSIGRSTTNHLQTAFLG